MLVDKRRKIDVSGNAIINNLILKIRNGETRELANDEVKNRLHTLRTYLQKANHYEDKTIQIERIKKVKIEMHSLYQDFAITKELDKVTQECTYKNTYANKETKDLRKKACTRLNRCIASFQETQNVKYESIAIYIINYILILEETFKFRGIIPLYQKGFTKEQIVGITGSIEYTLDELFVLWKSYITSVTRKFSHDWKIQEDLKQEGLILLTKLYEKKKDILNYDDFSRYFKGALIRSFSNYMKKYNKSNASVDISNVHVQYRVEQKELELSKEVHTHVEHMKTWVVENNMSIEDYQTLFRKTPEFVQAIGQELMAAMQTKD